MSPEAAPALRALLACREVFRRADAFRALGLVTSGVATREAHAEARERLRLAEVAAREALAALPDDAALEGLIRSLGLANGPLPFPGR